MEGAYALVRKSNLSVAVRLTCEEAYAIRMVVDKKGDKHLKSVALDVWVRAHGAGLWLGCDCRRESSLRPVVAPVRRKGDDGKYAYHGRVLGSPQLEHDVECVFQGSKLREKYDRKENQEARQPPKGFMSVLREPGVGEQLADERGRDEGGRRRRRRQRPALSRWLLRLLAEAGLTRTDSGAGFSDPRAWVARIRDVGRQIEVAPGRALSEWWFPWAMDWSKERVHTRLWGALGEWPEGYRPQAFLTRVASVVDAHVVGREGQASRVEVIDRIGRPMVGRHAVPGPYLFMGAVGLDGPGGGVECLRGFAQPIVGRDCLIPVDSDYERRAFETLLVTAKIAERAFPDARVEIEKPVFDIKTPEGRCLPDFLVTVKRGADEVRFVIEVMGFARASYLEGKQGTHPRMETLGTLCKMQATEFGEGKDGANAEGRKVTQRIRGILEQRWAQ